MPRSSCARSSRCRGLPLFQGFGAFGGFDIGEKGFSCEVFVGLGLSFVVGVKWVQGFLCILGCYGLGPGVRHCAVVRTSSAKLGLRGLTTKAKSPAEAEPWLLTLLLEQARL